MVVARIMECGLHQAVFATGMKSVAKQLCERDVVYIPSVTLRVGLLARDHETATNIAPECCAAETERRSDAGRLL